MPGTPNPAGPQPALRIGTDDVAPILDRLDSPALLLDLTSRVVLRANPAFLRFARCSAGEIAGLDLPRLFDLEGLEGVLRAAHDAGAGPVRGASCNAPDGGFFESDVEVVPLGGAGSAVILIYRPSGVPEDPAAAPARSGAKAAAVHPSPAGAEIPRAEADSRSESASRSAPPPLVAFTRTLAAVRDRNGLVRVLVEASSNLMGSARILLVAYHGGGGTEVLAVSGFPARSATLIESWLGGLMSRGQLSAESPRLVEDYGAEEGLAMGTATLTSDGAVAMAVFPLESEGRIVGAWVVGFGEARRARGCDLELGRDFAAHLAGILSGVVVLELTRREKAHHELLNRIVSRLRGPFDLVGVLASLTSELSRTLDADRCLILAAGASEPEAGATVRVQSEHRRDGLEPLSAAASIPFAGTSLGQAVLYSKEPLAVEDLSVRPDITEDHDDLIGRLGLRGLIVAKILSGGEFAGLVLVATTRGPRAWTRDEIGLVGAVADHAAVTLETGRLAKASEERASQIERERREWERTFDAIPDMLAIHDGYGRLLRVNLAMQVRLGGDPRSFIGRECSDVLAAVIGTAAACPHEEATRSHRAIAREVQGERGIFSLTAIPCFDAAGHCLYIIHVCKEITEEKQIREQLMQTEKMAAVGSLVSGVAHELNNPLAGVMGFSELLLDRETTDPKLKKSLQRIHDEAGRAARIVRNLLTFARKHKPESTMVDINALLGKTLELRAYELRVNKVQVETTFFPDLPMTLADPNQLLQVFLNVISNAEQAMREAHGKGKLAVVTAREGGCVRIVIEDDGPGIPEANLKKIFDPFFTTKAVGKGTGLGLSICHGIVKEHGGTITAVNGAEKGARFVIDLPVIEGVARIEPEARRVGPPERLGRILVVDDEITVREMVRMTLAARGHTVDAVDSGAAALEAVGATAYDIIVSDLKMPVMDGQEMYARLKKERAAMAERVVFISGDTVSADTHAFLEGAGRPYLLKPFTIPDLVDMVERALGPEGGSASAGAGGGAAAGAAGDPDAAAARSERKAG